MAELCAKPDVKTGPPLLSEGQVSVHTGPVDGGEKKRGLGGPLFVTWLTVSTMMAFAGLVMAAWAASKLQHRPTLVLVDSFQQASDKNWYPISHVYAGSGYWANTSLTMSHPRSDHGVVTYKGAVYTFGGTNSLPNGTQQVLGDMTRYNMYTGNRTDMPSMPEPRYRFGYAVANDKLYVFGGFNQVEPSYVETDQPAAPVVPVATMMVFDFNKVQWESIDPSKNLTYARGDLAGAAVGNRVYAIGGYKVVPAAGIYDPFAYSEMFDITLGRWTPIADMPTPRGDLSAQASGNMVYAIGGWNNTFMSTVEAYDTTTGKWVKRASMKYPRGDLATETMNDGNILAVGGEGGYSFAGVTQENQVALPWVELYLPSLDFWVPKASIFDPKFRFDIASPDGTFIYAFGGAATCKDEDGNQPEDCYRQVKDDILVYHDIPQPNIFVART